MLILVSMIRKSIVGTVALLLAFAGGCAEEETQTSGIDRARQDMQPLVEAACDWMFGCCSSGELVYQVGNFTVDADDCTVRLIDAIETGLPLELEQGGLSSDPAEDLLTLALSINEGRVVVDRAAVQACADSTSSRACNIADPVTGPVGRCTPSAVEVEADPCEPIEMFTGRQQAGEQCDGPWECEEGLRCVDFGISGVCALRAAEGENCFADAECDQGLICGYESGTCAPGALSGQPCAFSDPLSPVPGTESIRCADGLTCDAIALVCAGAFCSPGSPCSDIFNDTDCPADTWCVGNSLTQPSCQAPGNLGAACFKAEDCQTNFCDPLSETCGSLLGTGDTCFGNFECDSGFCFNGLCQQSFEPGMPCMSLFDEECSGGFCDQVPMNPICQPYAAEGGECLVGNECDPGANISCVDGVCLREPFPNGTTCFDGSQCESLACFQGECVEGAVVGAQCFTDGTEEPCIVGSFCQTALPTDVMGICTALRASGDACDSGNQCWGDCIVRFGRQMCDSTPALALGAAWCDGVE